MRNALLALTITCLSGTSAAAYDLGEYGKILGDARYRYEFVDQDGFDKNANAHTLRLRLGYETPVFHGLNAYIEGETIQHLGYAHFNDGVNGHTRYPGVNDAEDNAINQLYANYVYEDMLKLRAGRQKISFDNQRFIGASNWRQNDPTFDALKAELSPIANLKLSYAYSWNVHRSQGNRSALGEYEGRHHLLHGNYKLPHDISLSAYHYSLDMTDAVDASRSSQTTGMRGEWKPEGEGLRPILSAELARQSDFGDKPARYTELYQAYEAGAAYNDYSASFVFEQFGSNGRNAVQTPLAAGHNFNGWTDKFGNIPANGLKDYKLLVSVPLPAPEGQGLELTGQLHDFHAVKSDDHYGSEAGLGLTYKPIKNHAITAKASHYNADDFATDTTKFWLAYDLKF